MSQLQKRILRIAARLLGVTPRVLYPHFARHGKDVLPELDHFGVQPARSKVSMGTLLQRQPL
jgi:hypothetical protein